MDGGGIGKGQFIQFRYIVFYQAVIKVHLQGTFFQIHLFYIAKVTVKHILVIIVAELHHPVALTERIATPVQCRLVGVQCCLQGYVQVRRSHNAPLHRGKHLDVACLLPIGFGQAVLDKVYNLFGYRLWFFLLDEKEISLLAVAGIGELPLVDGMGTHHNTAGLRLPEDAC